MFRDSWDLMRRGDVEAALRQMQHDYQEMPSTMCAMELGVAYLWLKDYGAAWEHFNGFNQRYPRHNSGTYGMAGVAKWCLHMPEDAIAQWSEALRAEFADSSGANVKPALLLLFASVVKPAVFSRGEADALLAERAGDPRVRIWPGALLDFILGKIDESHLREQCVDERWADETMLHHWTADFFIGVLESARGNVNKFHEWMRKVGEVSWEEYDRCNDLFLSKLWSEEFYLARHESARPQA